MRFTARALGLAIAIGAAACLPGCAHQSRESYEPDPYLAAAGHLEYVSQSLEKYGTISVSTPFILSPTKEFEFGLKQTGKDYYDASRVEGFARRAEFEIFDGQVALSVNLEEVVKALKSFQSGSSPSKVDVLRKALTDFQTAQAGIDAAVNASGGLDALTPQQKEAITLAKSVLTRASEIEAKEQETGAPTFKSPDMPDLLKPEDRVALSALPDKFTDILPNFSGDLNLSPRQRINLAANDKMTQDIFNWFAAPKAADLGPNKLVYLCMLMVTCAPGSITREGYVAEVNVDVEYGDDEGSTDCPESDPDCPQAKPLVVAAYPMIDSQVLDLSSSVRQQFSFAAALQAVGYGIAGQAVADYAKRLEQDARTRSAITVGGATSYGGGNFGFRVEPRLIALGQAAKKKAQPAMKLETQVFPAMIMLILDKSDVAPEYGGTGIWKSIRFSAASRWTQLGKPTAREGRLSENQIMLRARQLDKANDIIDVLANREETEATGNNQEPPGFTGGETKRTAVDSDEEGKWSYQELRRRIYNLAAAGLGTTVYQMLPQRVSNEGNVYSVLPLKGWQNAPTILHISGDSLDLVTKATAGGIECEILDQQSGSLVIKCPGIPGTEVAAGDTSLPILLSTSVGTIKTECVNFSVKAKKPGGGEPAPTLTINRDAAGNVTLLKIEGDVDDVTKLEKLTELLKTGESGTFSIEIDGSAKASASKK